MAVIDPYAVLGVTADVPDAELRRVYRALVKQHHPDHNGGSPESTARFAQIQGAYTAILSRRAAATGPQTPLRGPQAAPDQSVEARIQAMEREIAVTGREKARRQAEVQAQQRTAARLAARQRAAYEAAAAAHPPKPTPEEPGQYSTEDSFTMIVDDAFDQIGERLRSSSSETKRQFARRLTDLFGDGDD